MIELLLRRRQMAMSKKEPFVNPYITDGLVLHLDGIEKGSTPEAWTDLINGIIFTKKAKGVTFNNDNVQFGGSNNNCLQNTSSYDFGTSYTITIELCYRDIPTSGTRTAFYAYGTTNRSISFQFLNGNCVVYSAGNGTPPKNGNWTAETTGTYSVSTALVMQNGESKGFASTDNYISRKYVGSIIGGSGRGLTIYECLDGKIHSLRIYNRHLSEEEVLHNQAIDNKRFNLGLNI